MLRVDRTGENPIARDPAASTVQSPGPPSADKIVPVVSPQTTTEGAVPFDRIADGGPVVRQPNEQHLECWQSRRPHCDIECTVDCTCTVPALRNFKVTWIPSPAFKGCASPINMMW